MLTVGFQPKEIPQESSRIELSHHLPPILSFLCILASASGTTLHVTTFTSHRCSLLLHAK